jgi:hypothetical protein
VKLRAQGWYRDPLGVHEDRYFSAGRPTKLVRDSGTESYDEPPAGPAPATDLVSAEPADSASGQTAGPSDLRRADEASNAPGYSNEAARQAAFDAFDQQGYWMG